MAVFRDILSNFAVMLVKLLQQRDEIARLSIRLYVVSCVCAREIEPISSIRSFF